MSISIERIVKMYLHIFALLIAGSVALSTSNGPDMFGIINILYMKASPSLNGKISLENMTSVYLSLDVNNTGSITRDQFVDGWMGITQQSQEMANAYFDMSDKDGNGVIDDTDVQEIFKRFDVDGDGNISDDEFVGHYKAIYVAAPFVVLYRRLLTREGIQGPVNREQFQTLFVGLSGEVDGSMSRKHLQEAWLSEDFGTTQDADNVVTSLDVDKDDVISKDDLGSRYDLLDDEDRGGIGIDDIMKILVVAKTGTDEDTIIG